MSNPNLCEKCWGWKCHRDAHDPASVCHCDGGQ